MQFRFLTGYLVSDYQTASENCGGQNFKIFKRVHPTVEGLNALSHVATSSFKEQEQLNLPFKKTAGHVPSLCPTSLLVSPLANFHFVSPLPNYHFALCRYVQEKRKLCTACMLTTRNVTTQGLVLFTVFGEHHFRIRISIPNQLLI